MSSSLPLLKQSVINESIDWSQEPTYGQFFLGSFNYFYDHIFSLRDNNITSDFARDFKLCYDRITIQDLILILILTIVWTLARFWTTKAIFKVRIIFY